VTLGATLVLGMGNPILSDDGVGLLVAGRLRQTPLPDHVEVAQSEVAGLRLLELVRGFTRVIIIDALKSPAEAGRKPGEILRYDAADFKGGHRYGSAHSIGLDTVLELGHRLGYDMPRDVVVFAIEAADVETFGEELSAPVAAAAARVVGLIVAELAAAADAA
jgi:hydrogenase maturation protease